MWRKVTPLWVTMMGMAAPGTLQACDLPFSLTFNRTSAASLAVGAGIRAEPGSVRDEGTLLTPAVHVAFGVGDRLVIKPGAGICTSTDEGPGTDLTAGGVVAYRVWTSAAGTSTAQLQAGFSRTRSSMDDEAVTALTVPLLATAEFRPSLSSGVALYAVFGFTLDRVTTEMGSSSEVDTNPDPLIGGGMVFDVGGGEIRFGVDAELGNDVDVGANIAFDIRVGG